MLDDLVVERIFPENYGTAQVNVKILKRDRKQVLLVKPSYTARTRPSRPTKTRSDIGTPLRPSFYFLLGSQLRELV